MLKARRNMTSQQIRKKLSLLRTASGSGYRALGLSLLRTYFSRFRAERCDHVAGSSRITAKLDGKIDQQIDCRGLRNELQNSPRV